MPALRRTCEPRSDRTALFKAITVFAPSLLEQSNSRILLGTEGEARNSFSGQSLQLLWPVAGGTQVLTLIERFAPLASRYDVLLCDVWGVVHNGVAAFPEAGDALARFRAGGGTVIFITNAPYPAHAVQRFLDRLGVRGDSYDAITSSGDVTRGIVETRLADRVFHLGPPRDRPIFAGLEVNFAPIETADYVVCSGLFDDTIETPENYRDAGVDAPAFAVHGLRQSRRSGRARRHAGLLRRRLG
jgi:Haloacid dehalogenase-like hydrolase